MADVVRTITALLTPIANRVKAVLARAVVDGVNDATMAQELRLRVLSTEVLGRVENLAGIPGITSYPPADSEAVVGCIGGMRDHPIALAIVHRETRPKAIMAEGDVVLYHATSGARIHLHDDGSIEVSAPGGVTIAGDVSISGDLDVSGSVTAGGDVADGTASMATDRTIYNSHTHKENGTGGGVTDPTTQTQ